jgi:hypothetical protein
MEMGGLEKGQATLCQGMLQAISGVRTDIKTQFQASFLKEKAEHLSNRATAHD